MSDENYRKLIEKISKTANVEVEELERRVEAKRAKLSGLISLEGAAQVIAAELGINFDNELLKIEELVPGMRKVNVVGKIINLYPVREFTTKKGEPGKVVNMILADETSNIKVVLWDTNHISLIESGDIAKESVVEISNASMRNNEIHLGSFSEFKKSNSVLEDVKTEAVIQEKNLFDLKLGDNAKVRAFVVQSFDPRFFNVCSQCKKKVVEDNGTFTCAEHGVVEPEKRALINIVIDDGTENIRAVLFHENLKLLGLTEFNDPALLLQQRMNMAGKEFYFIGNVRRNDYFNNQEFIVNSVEQVDLDKLQKDLD